MSSKKNIEKKFLLLEDNDDISGIVKYLLWEDEGIDICFVKTVEEANRMLKKEKFAGFIVDILLPDGDGLAWLRHLRTSGYWQPAIVITSMSKEDVQGKLNGTNSLICLNKTHLVDRLMIAVRDCIALNSDEVESDLVEIEKSFEQLEKVLNHHAHSFGRRQSSSAEIDIQSHPAYIPGC